MLWEGDMANKQLETYGQNPTGKPNGANKSWIDKVLEAMDTAGDTIIDFVKYVRNYSAKPSTSETPRGTMQEVARPIEEPKPLPKEQPKQIPKVDPRAETIETLRPVERTAQPKYFTAFGGLLALVGTFFPWAYLAYYGEKTQDYAGFTQLPGMLTAVVGLVIIFLAFFIQTKPGKANSLASSALALVDFLICLIWPMVSYEPCFEAFFGGVCEYQTVIGSGFGYILSMFALFLTLVFGLIPNPRQTMRQ